MKRKQTCLHMGIPVLIAVLIACGNGPSETPSPASTDQKGPSPEQTLASHQMVAKRGKVLEIHDVEPYTYVRLDDGAGHDIWAAVPKTQVAIGEEIVLEGGTVMTDFTSKTLNRTFASIIFATGLARPSQAMTAKAPEAASGTAPAAGPSGAGMQSMGPQASGGSARAIVPYAGLQVERSTAPNSHTVEEIFKKSAELNKAKVTVRGQVVKVSPNIMGRNWIHIQDGTGNSEENTHDLVATSAEMVQKGDIVSLEGVVSADKDFGFGYRYDVIIEDAVVVKQE